MTDFSTPEYDPSGSGSFVSVIDDISHSQTTRRAARVITTGLRDFLHADGVTLVLKDGDECYYYDEDAISPLWKGRRFPAASCISGWVIANDAPVVIRDIRKDPRIPQDLYSPTFVRSLAMVPIRHKMAIAAIGAYWSTVYEASVNDLKVMTAIASAASTVL